MRSTSVAERWRNLALRIPTWSIAGIQADLRNGRGTERFASCTIDHLGGGDLIGPETRTQYEQALADLIACDHRQFSAIDQAVRTLGRRAVVVATEIGQRERIRRATTKSGRGGSH